MRIRTSINHQYSIIALRRKKRMLAVVAIVVACTAMTNLAVEAGIVAVSDNRPTMSNRLAVLRPGDALTTAPANARLRSILADRTSDSTALTPGDAGNTLH